MGKYRGREQLHKLNYEGDGMTSEGEEVMSLGSPGSPPPAKEKKLMRPWLMDILNDDKIDGIQWLDRDEGTFRVSWKHGARSGYNAAKDASVFELWAEHTGRYTRESCKSPDTKRWKANFRCALNSLSDVKLLKGDSKSKGNDAFRVYKFLTPKGDKTKVLNNNKSSKRKHPQECEKDDKRRCLRRRSRTTTRSYKETDDSSLNSTDVEETKHIETVVEESIEVIIPTEEKQLFKPELRETDRESGITHGTLPMHGSGYTVKVIKINEENFDHLQEDNCVSETSVDQFSIQFQSMSPGEGSVDTTSRPSTPGEAPLTHEEAVIPLLGNQEYSHYTTDLLLQRSREHL